MRSFKGALLSALMMISIVALTIPLLSPSPAHAALTLHDPILIDSNDNFTSPDPVNGGGSGTENDPYIIENWNISAENASGVEIINTTAHFVIRNCLVANGEKGEEIETMGILLSNVINGRIENNTCENSIYGILLMFSNNNLISNNLSGNNWFGINLDHSSNNTLENNTCSNNEYGIYLDLSSKNFISNNILEKNLATGIFSSNSDNNLISNNIVENNSWYGIYLWNDSNNNLIYHNNFINNAPQARDECSNYWDIGYQHPGGGNYWSDYVGADANGDEIGDTPYSISGDNNQDRYPLMKPFGEASSAPSSERSWSLIAGIVGVIVIIGIVALVYMRIR